MLEVWLDFLLEPGRNLAGTYVRIISGLVFLLWQAKKTTILLNFVMAFGKVPARLPARLVTV